MKKMFVLLALMLASVSLATVHTVNLVGSSFSPQNITIQQGDTVRWIKPAGGFHNVAETSHNPATFRSGDPTSAAFTYQFPFAAPLEGLFNYECEIHAPGMVGSVTVEAGGTPPTTPTNPIPNNNSTGMPLLGFLIWEDEGATHHIVQFGTSNPPPVVNNNFPGMMYSYSNLNPGTQYFWKITAVNGDGETAGPVWNFTTGTLPDQAANPSPPNGASSVPITTALEWNFSNGATSYEVFLGTSNPLPSIGTVTQNTITPASDLLHSTAYMWRVDASNSFGTTTGPTWNFTSEAGSAVGDKPVPTAFELQAAYPNPFNSSVRIGLNIAQESQTVVRIFDIVGQEVSTLVNSKMSAGQHQLEWNASGQAAGLYFLKCECAGISQTQKLIYLP